MIFSKRSAPFVIILIVALVTVGVSAIVLRSKRRAMLAAGTVQMPDGKTELKPTHVRGPETAPVSLEEFGDLQCPMCATTSNAVKALEAEFGGRLRVVFWQFPLPLAVHEHGAEAANVAEAASRQGRFWEMHDLLYSNQLAWSRSGSVRADFEKFAGDLKLDVEEFRKDLSSPSVAARVAAEHDYGVKRGVKGTPTIFINGREFPPPFTIERLRAEIAAAANQPNPK